MRTGTGGVEAQWGGQLPYFYGYALWDRIKIPEEVSVFACRTDGLAFFYTDLGFGPQAQKGVKGWGKAN